MASSPMAAWITLAASVAMAGDIAFVRHDLNLEASDPADGSVGRPATARGPSRQKVPDPVPPPYKNHANLLVYRDEAGKMQPVETPALWRLRRADVLKGMEQAMGPLPDPSRRVPLDVKTLSKEETSDYTRIKLTYAAEPGEPRSR